ncbi:GrpB family protein [Cryobacterium lactosi]|uniref:GrpB family protein n=1 Tax=Cryobacterium lactosi TaxID=1259202 RepID=UPI00141ABD7F|nr:GrpB family protein [Cryobacterium lactosi]
MITVEPYSPEWPKRFRQQAELLERALTFRITAIEHVGSTAIPGLAAKPVIDLAARTPAGVDPFSLEPFIEGLGYRLHRSGPKTHAVYTRGDSTGRTEILHVFTATAWPTSHQRVFRDKLQHDATARRRYGELKVSLAASGMSGMAYTATKLQLIQELLNEERASRGLPLVDAWEK